MLSLLNMQNRFSLNQKVYKNEKEYRMSKKENVPGVGNKVVGEEHQEIQVSGIDDEIHRIFYREIKLLKGGASVSDKKTTRD